MHNITTPCSSIHKFIILGPSGPKPAWQLCALRCPELSVKSHRVTGASQPDSVTDWSISQLYRQKAANGCSSRMPRHTGTIPTSALPADICWCPGPGSLSLTQCILVLCQTKQLRSHHCLSPMVAASGMPAGGGGQRTALPQSFIFSAPTSSQTPPPPSHLKL